MKLKVNHLTGLIAALGIGMSVALGQGSFFEQEEQLVDKLLYLDKQGKLEEATALALKFVKKNKQDSQDLLFISYLRDLNYYHEYDRTIAFVNTVPNAPVGQLAMGLVNKECGVAFLFRSIGSNPNDLAIAKKLFQQSVADDDNIFKSHLYLGVICGIEGETEDAKVHFLRALLTPVGREAANRRITLDFFAGLENDRPADMIRWLLLKQSISP
jgi:tetratricopeptide (TPR) repeat protein